MAVLLVKPLLPYDASHGHPWEFHDHLVAGHLQVALKPDYESEAKCMKVRLSAMLFK